MQQQLKVESEIFTRAWRMLKAYQDMTADQWDAALDAALDVYAAANGPEQQQLAKSLALAVLDYLEARQEGRKWNNG